MDARIWRLIVLSVAGLLTIRPASAHKAPSPAIFAPVFNQYQLSLKQFYGVFDSTDSWFVLYTDTAFQSPFDSACIRSHGKTWHRNQVVDCNSYFTVSLTEKISIYQDGKDSADIDSVWAAQMMVLEKKHLELWKISGEFFTVENAANQYSGIFSGTFCIYFLWNTQKETVLPAPAKSVPDEEPLACWTGYWRSFHSKDIPPVPFCWSSATPETNEDGNWLLPDLRIQADGSQSFSNKAIFDKGCMTPSPAWYQ